MNTSPKTQLVTLLAGALTALALAGSAAAATTALEGGATQEAGHVKLVADISDASTTNDFSTARIAGLNLTFGGLTTLNAEFNVTDDDCANASPRYTLFFSDGAVIHVAFGPASTFTDCAKNTWLSTGNLVGQLDGCRWQSGTDPCLTAEELQAFAGKTITDVRLVVDASWNNEARLAEPEFADKEQTVLVRNLRVNDSTFFAPAQQGAAQSPAQACRAERAAMGEAAFREKYGTNRNKANAFGKCVSAKAKSRR